MSNRIAIVGAGMSRTPNRTVVGIALEAIINALQDAGLKKEDVDSFIVTPTGNFNDGRIGYNIAEHLGVYAKPLSANIDSGPGAAAQSLDIASWFLAEGRSKCVVLVDAGTVESSRWASPLGVEYENWLEPGAAANGSPDVTSSAGPYFQEGEHIWGGAGLAAHAIVARRHMHEFGTTEQQLASVAVAARYNAALNPDAVHRDLITIDSVLQSPMVASPLRELMCSNANDAGAAVIVTTEERARGLKTTPVYLLGSGAAASANGVAKAVELGSKGYGLTRTVGKLAADDAFESAGLQRSDIDVACWSDPTVITTLLALEDYGFCEKGEGGEVRW